jgi:hypothetical protein
MTESDTQSLPSMLSPEAIAEGIARNAQGLEGLDVVSVGPMFVDDMGGWPCLHAYVVLPKNGAQDYASILVILSVKQDPFLAQVNRTALVVALEGLFGRVRLFGNAWPSPNTATNNGRMRTLAAWRLLSFVNAGSALLDGVAGLRAGYSWRLASDVWLFA